MAWQPSAICADVIRWPWPDTAMAVPYLPNRDVFTVGPSLPEATGAIGVIGPTRLNYARIIPMVDYTAKVIGRLIG